MVLPAVLTCLGRQDAEPLAVVAAVGVAIEMEWAVVEMVVAVLAVTSGGGCRGMGKVWTVNEMACFLSLLVVDIPVIMLFFLFFRPCALAATSSRSLGAVSSWFLVPVLLQRQVLAVLGQITVKVPQIQFFDVAEVLQTQFIDSVRGFFPL